MAYVESWLVREEVNEIVRTEGTGTGGQAAPVPGSWILAGSPDGHRGLINPETGEPWVQDDLKSADNGESRPGIRAGFIAILSGLQYTLKQGMREAGLDED